MKSTLNQAIERLRSGDPNGAERICSRILGLDPDQPQALHVSGLCAYQNADYHKAGHYLDKALSLDAQNAGLHNDLGLVRLALEQYPEAMDSFQRAIGLSPEMAEAYLNAGLAAQKLGDLTAAAKSLTHALELKPDYAKASFLLGQMFQRQGLVRQAIDCFKRAIESNGRYVAALNHLSACLLQTGEIKAALEFLEQAYQVDPHCAETCCNLGNVLRRRHRFEDACNMYQKAITLSPQFAQAHFNLGLVHLLLGRFEQGWREYEWRLNQFPPTSGYPHRHGLPLWRNPHQNSGGILVYDEQGYGDVFMFARFLGKLKASGMHIVLETRPALTPLMQYQDIAHQVVSRNHSPALAGACACCVPLSSLAGIFGTTLENIPAPVPYLRAEPAKQSRWAQRLTGEKPRIGLVWSGSSVDPSRRIALHLFRQLNQNQRFAWYGLQKDDAGDQAAGEPWLINMGRDLADFSDTAAVLANLDLVISIDTAVAHLAGAMGRPVWVLLPYVPDWRWFLNRSDSPWYPTMRLFRQTREADWQIPLRQIQTALSQWQSAHQRIGKHGVC